MPKNGLILSFRFARLKIQAWRTKTPKYIIYLYSLAIWSLIFKLFFKF
jgi:hypothetical protein